DDFGGVHLDLARSAVGQADDEVQPRIAAGVTMRENFGVLDNAHSILGYALFPDLGLDVSQVIGGRGDDRHADDVLEVVPVATAALHFLVRPLAILERAVIDPGVKRLWLHAAAHHGDVLADFAEVLHGRRRVGEQVAGDAILGLGADFFGQE